MKKLNDTQMPVRNKFSIVGLAFIIKKFTG